MLKTQMHNGVTVSDWLGTAMTAAKVASSILDDIREGVAGEDSLGLVETELVQALEEVQAVRTRLGV